MSIMCTHPLFLILYDIVRVCVCVCVHVHVRDTGLFVLTRMCLVKCVHVLYTIMVMFGG